jgi:hypothetical protein
VFGQLLFWTITSSNREGGSSRLSRIVKLHHHLLASPALDLLQHSIITISAASYKPNHDARLNHKSRRIRDNLIEHSSPHEAAKMGLEATMIVYVASRVIHPGPS